ncbi:A disintegrin and metalloproteinase with thrombospondin motifs 9-like isoform X2 [Acanthaster planci]|uniref:A disintegrin and metalloproteinase with thrombospondin motifs 9-like isoform X1 n=1 Tax=Acanthaster planci TaxID=133434 RepID=A0A8B7ZUK5_ACAPL|nr:A disintegrin and metalloproteinase with thrombospondin motifs 9-like isoform X1 [Acanthaster planci]XP_022109099.1 A disintegrin and metalloproteinase with thrombospondin motifs 9-like isoform X2 [Acanthaster planci]
MCDVGFHENLQDSSVMCILNVNTTLSAALILVYLVSVRLAQGFNFKSVHWTTHGSERLAQLSEYEIVTPVRLDSRNGLPLPSDGTTRHFEKRSARIPLNSGREAEDDADQPQATFLLGAFHQQFQLNLSRDNSFLSPSFVVEFLGDEDDDEDSARELDTSAPLHCFYRGVVNGQPASTAVFSLCDGMHGLFQTPEGMQYFVEPLEDSTSSDEGSARPHIVYPTTALQDLNKNSGCGLTDDDLSSKGPLPNSTNDVPGPHSFHHRKRHHGNRRHFHSEDARTANTLAAQLHQMHQRISKSIKQEDNNSSKAMSDSVAGDSHRREKRFISYTRHVELMVVADSKMLNHHGENVEHYLLTLVALVNKIFKDPSIGNDINIVLVKLLVLRQEQENLSITSDAQLTLRNFCVWQQDQNQREDTHPHHYDTAVLITKEDICRSTFDCDTLGLAELGTMCDPFRSCSIVQDNGLSASFTMAHELGHVFNLPHDDNSKCREFAENMSGKYGVMAPTLNYQINPWIWSRCSKTQITEYLDMGYGQCLLDPPTDAQNLPSYQPGEVYNVSKQCELVFGEGSSVCPIMKMCSRLWCTGSSQGSQRGCRTQQMPWADGTPCGHNKWCDRGECIARQNTLVPVDGGWGKWEPYGDCSRTCGGGVKQAVRQCTQPVPENGGKYCIGRRVRFRSCNARPCPENSTSFREQQCAAFNGNNFNIQGVPRDVRWVAKYTGVQIKDRCSLFCRVEGSIAFYKLGKKVVDGTPCGPDTDDICVQGQCWKAGCDHILGSQTTRDNCGVCGGDNRACRTVTGTYNKAQYGYNKVVEIPAGSTKLDIRQHSYLGTDPEDDNYLAIRNSNGDYLLNGHFVVSLFTREIKIGNVVLQYSGSNNSIEKITCYERITSNITIYVLSVGKVLPPDIRYSYNVPIKGEVIYLWDVYGPWGACSKICKGERERDLRCLRQKDRLHVKDSSCRGRRPQPITSKCNTGCEVRWQIMAESDCSATCGPGRRTRRVQCIKSVNRRRTSVVVADAHCHEQARPAEVVECNNECEQAHWEYSSWSQCSRSCDGGTRRRSASCRDSSGYYTQDSNCDSSPKVIAERCNTQQCPIWAVESWSECSVTCGSGEMQRSVRCYQGSQMVDFSQCDLSEMPETIRPCQMEECAVWHQGEWGPCSATCGQASMQRLVSCMVGGQPVDITHCDLSLMPETTRPCQVTECPFWHQGEWSSCSVSCGQGKKQRLVRCLQGNYIVDSSRCNHSLMPESVAPCNAGECAYWQASGWGPCSVTCGLGEQQRRVSCYQGNQKVDVSHCVLLQKPESVSPCQMEDCAAWEHGEWGECSVSCGQGMQLREVSCRRGSQTIRDHECDQALAPTTSRPCQMIDCAVWKHGEWGQCSGTCGHGEKQRFVSCYQGNRDVPSSQCDQASKPDSVTSCKMAECPAWHQGEWGPCSAACGEGEMQRTVACYQGNHEVDISQCDLTLIPASVTPCKVTDCAYWQHGQWGPCSVTCGQGEKRRSINCYRGNQIVESSQCNPSLKPDTMTSCQTVDCPTWRGDDWGACSVTCGQGTRQRAVSCYQRNQKVDITLCDLTMMLDTTRPCEMIECADWYQGEWGPCSVSCGNGEMQRRVSCSQGGRNVDAVNCDQNSMPETVRGCQMPECPTWQTGQWGQCSKTCGQGTMQRRVDCYQGSSIVGITQCDLTLMPASSRECEIGQCPVWRHGSWGPCSVSCGLGYQLRGIQCRLPNDTPVSDDQCNPGDQPPNHQDCRMPTCLTPTLPTTNPPDTRPPIRPVPPTIPRTTAAAPDPAILRRPSALTPRQSPKPSLLPLRPTSSQRSLADPSSSITVARTPSEPRPLPKSSPVATVDVMREGPRSRYSSQWRTGMWTECSTTCGYGTRERYVSCRDRYGYISEERNCNTANRPAAIEQCQIRPCPNWRTGQWNRCSVTCGQGMTSRYVACVNSDNSIASDDDCNPLEKPSDLDICSSHDCPVDQPVASGMAGERAEALTRGGWRTGLWSKCSSTCGSGLRHRVVICQDEFGGVETCTEESRPRNIEVCNTRVPCPLWSFGEWGQCSATCGGGIQSRLVRCRLRSGRTLPNSCNILTKPEDTRICRSNPCPTHHSWRPRPWSLCSVTCGTGIQQRTVTCQDEAGTLMEDEECEKEGVEKPATQRDCQEEECPSLVWRVSEWSDCSVTCGVGSRQRTVTCEDDTGDEMQDEECWREESKPDSQRECQLTECIRPKWTVGDWSDCSVTCGVGYRERRVSCIELENEKEDKECEASGITKPISQTDCQQVQCPTSRLRWTVGDWTKCSVTCGIGTRERMVTCEDAMGILEPDKCETDGLPKPATHTDCQQAFCPRLRPKWVVGNWSQCSVTCNKGYRSRTVSCEDAAGEERQEEECEMEGMAKPASVKECRLETCPRPKWRVTKWSDCSVTCDRGVRVRQATCQLGDQVVEESLCLHKKPKTSKRCKRSQCMKYRWKKGRWSQCSKSCGGGRKFRKVHCTDSRDNEVDNGLCAVEHMPRDNNKCNTHSCDAPWLAWQAGPWGECSAACGPGQQSRTVTCQAYSPDGWVMRADDKTCHQESRPQDIRSCFISLCSSDVSWMMGPWSQCSKDCGGGVKERKVQCRDRQGRRQPASSCGPPTIRPETRDVCNHEPCQPKSCRDIQLQRNLHDDQEYSILVQGRPLTVYCHSMTTEGPTEFVTLPAGEVENFAEIYPKRLLRATQCPYNGNRNDDCECTDEGHREAGLTTFTKLRLNITSMEIIISDGTFADVRYGKFVPYATAGDCYSSSDCPQGRFHINLIGTQLALAPEVDWGTEGYAVSRRLARDRLNQRVAGRCGGYCGTCFPDKRRGGLRVTFVS